MTVAVTVHTVYNPPADGKHEANHSALEISSPIMSLAQSKTHKHDNADSESATPHTPSGVSPIV